MRLAAFAFILAAAGAISAAGATAASGQAGQAPAMPMHEHRPGTPSTSLVVTVDHKDNTLSPADLQAMPQHTLKVHNGHTDADEVYTGVAVSDLLAKYGVSLEGAGAKRIYHSYLRLTGTDQYFVLYSASEVEPGLRNGDAIIALTVDGKPLGANGAFEMVISGEKKPARWVRNLASIAVVTVE